MSRILVTSACRPPSPAERRASGLAGILALGRAPAFSQAPKKLVMAHIVAPPESSAVAFVEMADAVNKQAEQWLEIEFHAGTLLTKESRSSMRSNPATDRDRTTRGGGAAERVFPEMVRLSGALSRQSYDQGLQDVQRGDRRPPRPAVSGPIQAQGLCFYDYGFRHFWTTAADCRAQGFARPQAARAAGKVFATRSTVWAASRADGLGRGDPAAQQGVIDGADLRSSISWRSRPTRISKYCSMTYPQLRTDGAGHQSRLLERPSRRPSRNAADASGRAGRRFADCPRASIPSKGQGGARAQGDDGQLPRCRGLPKIAQEKVWPQYQKEYTDIWEEIVATKV